MKVELIACNFADRLEAVRGLAAAGFDVQESDLEFIVYLAEHGCDFYRVDPDGSVIEISAADMLAAGEMAGDMRPLK